MQIAVAQISDLHIASGKEKFLSRAKEIRNAIHQSSPHAEECVVVISGDIAYSGLSTQYDAAWLFFDELKTLLLDLPSVKHVRFIAVPGNHDCDFSHESDVRQFLLRDINALYESDLKTDSDTTQALVSVQKNFFSFEARLTGSKDLGPAERLIYERLISFGNYSILFRCFNTAWLSRKHELQGKLFLPADALAPSVVNASLCASIFHHPYNWLDAANYRTLREIVEQTSDLVFTGHEHVPGGGSVERFSGEHLHYIEGGALQGDKGELDSAFNIFVVDFETGSQRLEQFRWNGEAYTSKDRKNWAVAIKNPARQRHLFRVNTDFFEKLTDPGADFQHKRKRNLRLTDFFVYPDLRCSSIKNLLKKSQPSQIIYSKDVVAHLRSTNHALIVGPDHSGKTTLLKTLFVDLRTDYIPLFIDAADCVGKISDHRFRALIEGAVETQYDKSSIERFAQLEPARRLLLFDNFHLSNLNKANEARLLELSRDYFGHIIVTISDSYRLRALATRLADDDPFKDFDEFDIKEFGHRLRGQLIYKWLALGRDTASELSSLDHEVRATEKIINTLLGKNVVPAVPFNIVSLLHMMESSQSHATPDGSYGTFYELLIKARLGGSSSAGSKDADLKATYASVIAYAMFRQDQRHVADSDLRTIHKNYTDKFDVSPDFHKTLKDLVDARVLEKFDGKYGFKYRHVYFYFVAKYFERGLRRPTAEADALRSELKYMADRLHSEELANIVLFYLHLSHDWILIEYLIAHARRIFGNREQCDLQRDVEFVNKIYKEPPKALILDSDVERHREQYHKQLDEAEEQEDEGSFQLDPKTPYDDGLDDIYKINSAFKTLQVLGQVLRSSAGSMEAEPKLDIVTVCYELGLRMLNVLMEITDKHIDEIRVYLSMLIRERAAVSRPDITAREILKLTDEAVIWVAQSFTYGIIKRISYSVGHPHLEETYERAMRAKNNDMAIAFIDLAIRMDHSPTVPEFAITKLRDRVVGNTFAYSVLQQMVVDFLYLYRIDLRTSQKLGTLFNIQGVTAPKFLLSDDKRG